MTVLHCPQCRHVFPDANVRFVPLPYRPEGGTCWRRFPVFLLEMLFAGALLGWIVSRLGMKAYLVFIFPMSMGLVLAGLVFLGCTWAKVRNPSVVGLVGVASATMAMLSLHYTDYQRTLGHLRYHSSTVPAEVAARLGEQPSLGDYLEGNARVGLTIVGRSEVQVHLGYSGTWIFWLLELAIVASITFYGGRQSALEPFCGRCSEWQRQRQIGTLRSPAQDVLGVMKGGRLAELEDHLPAKDGGNVILTVFACQRCREHTPIAVFVYSKNRTAKGTMKCSELARLTYSGEALLVLEKLIHESPATEKAPLAA